MQREEKQEQGKVCELRVVSAKYGNEGIRQIDVTALIQSKIKNNGLAFHPASAVSGIVGFVDPCPGVPKYLHLVVGTKKNIFTKDGCIGCITQNDLEQKEKKKEEIYGLVEMKECGMRWQNPMWLHPLANVRCEFFGGLGNQIYCLMTAVQVTRYTTRALAFPFVMVNRRTCMDSYDIEKAIVGGYAIPCTDLIDATTFINGCGLRLYYLSEFKSNNVDRKEFDSFLSSYFSQLSIPRINIYATPVQKFAYHAYSETEGILLKSLLEGSCFNICISDRQDYDALINVLLSIAPALKWATIANRLYNLLLESGMNAVIHIRVESDWQNVFHDKVITPTILLKQINIWQEGLKTDTVCFSKHSTSLNLHCFYLMGEVPQIFVNELKILAPHIKWLTRTDIFSFSFFSEAALSSLPLTEDNIVLSFEEGAIIDREIALKAPLFFGFAPSSLSLLIALERAEAHHSWALYNPEHVKFQSLNNFFWKGSNPLADQLGTQPRPVRIATRFSLK